MAVVVLSNLPPCGEQDVLRALMPYGAIYSVQLMPSQRQATARFQNAAEAAALARRGAVFIGQTSCPVSLANQQPTTIQAPAAYDHVRITVSNLAYPITQQVVTDVCHSIGSPPEKVYIYPSSSGDSTVVALVKFSDPSFAKAAVEKLNGANIYPDCCAMVVEYAVVEPPAAHPVALPTPLMPTPPQPPYATFAPMGYAQPLVYAQPSFAQGQYAYGGAMYPPVMAPPMPPVPPVPGTMNGYGVGGRGGRHPAMARGGVPAWGGRGRDEPGFGREPYGRGREAFGRGRDMVLRGGYGHAPAEAYLPAIVLVSNVPVEVPLFNLFALLEVYGNVLGMKRQYSSPTNVVVRFQNHVDAKGVAFYLNQAPFFGSTISAKLFGGYNDRAPFRSENGADPTNAAVREFDFTGFHHRSNPTAIANPSRKFCPSENVFVTNLMAEITDEVLSQALSEKGHSPVDIVRKGPNSAIVAFPTAGIAVEMIVACHTFLVQGRYLKLMFSGLSPEQTRNLPARPGGPVDNDDEPPAAPVESDEPKELARPHALAQLVEV